MALLTQTGLRINRYCSMADFPFFKMAAVRHLGFLKVKNFNFRSGSKAQYASSCQISRRSVEPLRRYGRFSIFQDGSGFWKFHIFYGWDAQEGRTASAGQILAKSLKTRLRYGDFSIFQDGGRPLSWIFKSWKFQIPVQFGGPICVTVPNFAKEISKILDGGGRHLEKSKIGHRTIFINANSCSCQKCHTPSRQK